MVVISYQGYCREFIRCLISRSAASQDLHTVELEDFRHGGTNITCLRLVDPENPLVQRVMKDWTFGELRHGRAVDTLTPSQQVGKGGCRYENL